MSTPDVQRLFELAAARKVDLQDLNDALSSLCVDVRSALTTLDVTQLEKYSGRTFIAELCALLLGVDTGITSTERAVTCKVRECGGELSIDPRQRLGLDEAVTLRFVCDRCSTVQ